MANDLAFEIERYSELVDYLPQEDEPEEVIYTLLFRDRIHDALRAGAKVPETLACRLSAADEQLVKMRDSLVHRFPGVFEDRAPAEYWWWHLDKGPNVRVA